MKRKYMTSHYVWLHGLRKGFETLNTNDLFDQ
jgi:hypothetical protein